MYLFFRLFIFYLFIYFSVYLFIYLSLQIRGSMELSACPFTQKNQS